MEQTTLDLTTIEHLDFDPKCKGVNSDCENTATWRFWGIKSCCGYVSDNFYCGTHYNFFQTASERVWLARCGHRNYGYWWDGFETYKWTRL